MAKKPRTKQIKTSKPTFIAYKKIKLTYGQTISFMVVVGIALFGLSGYSFYQNVFTNPDRVLNDMLAKSLQTNSIQRNINQSNSRSSIDQTYYNTYSPNVAMQSIVQLREGDIQNNQVTKVTNETIGTKDKDFVRYTAISLPTGSPTKDFKDVLNVWGKREKTEKGENPSFFNESIFSIVPFANLPRAEQQLIIKEANDVKLYDYTEAKKSYQSGRPVITYTIALKPESLLKVLSRYATLTGYGDKEQLNPDQYKDSQDINIKMTVDLLSRHVKTIKFTDSARVEKYGAYGLQRQIQTPSQTISVDELQSKLSKFQ